MPPIFRFSLPLAGTCCALLCAAGLAFCQLVRLWADAGLADSGPLLWLGLGLALLCVLSGGLVIALARRPALRQPTEEKGGTDKADETHDAAQNYALHSGMLRSVLDNIQGIIFLRDRQARYITINSQFTTMLGMTLEQVRGKTDADLLPPDLADFCAMTDEAAMHTDGPYFFEQSLPKPDGAVCDYLFSKKALFGEDGSFNGILGVGIDVTLLKQTQRELAEAKQRAEEASTAKSAFLSTVSHEIRTPMNAIVGFVHLFDRSNLEARQKEYLDKIRLASASLLDIINNVLDLSKIESGRLELEHVPFRLDALLHAVSSLAENAAQAKGIQFALEVAPDVPLDLVGDPTRVQQVLTNLVNNAVKFTDRGGVSLRVAPDAEPPQDRAPAPGSDGDGDSNVPCEDGSACAALAFVVSDSGIGMSPEQLARVFEPFTQADASTTRKYGGTGLGLSICRELVELMRGSIRASSQQGSGSSFHVVLPLQHDSKATGPSPASAVGTPCARTSARFTAHVLLAEDNMINQEIARALLEDMGLRVDVAEDGQMAVDMAKKHRYDLIFMDMQMPVMDGLHSTRLMRALSVEEPYRWLGEVPIVAMTANAMQEDRKNCLDAGMNDHLGKPLDPALLRATLAQWLPAGACEIRQEPSPTA